MNESLPPGMAMLTECFSLRMAVTLLHFLWQGCAIAVVVFTANRALRDAAATWRYALHTAAMLLLLMCVMIMFATVEVPNSRDAVSGDHGITGDQDNTATRAVESSVPVHKDSSLDARHFQAPSKIALEHGANHDSAPRRSKPQDSQNQSRAFSSSSAFIEAAAPAIVLLYYVGVGVFLLRLVSAVRYGHRLHSTSTALTEPELLDLVTVQAARIGLRITPDVRYSAQSSVPAVIGVLRPVILLPCPVVSGLTHPRAVGAHREPRIGPTRPTTRASRTSNKRISPR